MTVSEFSNGMDTLINAYSSTGMFGTNNPLELDEYEKSVYLTHAQEKVVKQLYSPETAGVASFEQTEERRRQLDFLVFQRDYTEEGVVILKLDDDTYTHTIFNLPPNCWYIIFEQVKWSTNSSCTNGKVAMVVPVTHDDYQRIRNNPFRGPNNRRALRLDGGFKEAEIVSSNAIGTYTIRYLAKPEPIVLVDLPEELSIDGICNVNPCKLPSIIHRTILEEAVKEALISRNIGINNPSK